MQAGDAHQVSHSGTSENLPLRTRNGVLIAQGERNDDAGIWRPWQMSANPLAHGFAQIVEPGFQPGLAIGDGDRPGQHPSLGAYAPFQKPGFVVEAARIMAAARPEKAHRQAQTLTAAQDRCHAAGRAEIAIQVQQDTFRRTGARRIYPLDAGHEARTARRRFDETLDAPEHAQVAALPGGFQGIGKAYLGTPGGIGEARQTSQTEPRRPSPASGTRQEGNHHRQRSQGPKPAGVGQVGLDLQQTDADGKRQNQQTQR
jgi:hypothetical protein